MAHPPHRSNPRVSVTEVVRIVRCEKQAQLDHRFGETRDAFTETRRQEGVRAHAQFERQNDRRCYVATALLGASSPETLRLRRWRDEALMPHRLGRQLVRCYYAVSPWCLRHVPPAMAPLLRWALRTWVRHGLTLNQAPSLASMVDVEKAENVKTSRVAADHGQVR